MGKTNRNKKKATKKADDGDIISDNSMPEERFAAAETRPQFRVPKASASKVVLDDRFSSVLTDSRFQLQEKDKYGRGGKKKRNRNTVKEELESFYVVENQEEKSNRDDDSSKNSRKTPETEEEEEENQSGESDSDSDSKTSDVEKVEDPVSRIAYLTAFSRGETGVSSSSEDDDSSESSDDDDDDSDEDSMYGTAGILDPLTKQNDDDEIEISYDTSPYLVVTNMDWENIRAIDLFCIISSFAPPGAIKKVTIFQSDFGMEQMAKDKLHGPTGIWQKNKENKEKLPLEGRSGDINSSDEEDSGSEESTEMKLNFEESHESDFDPEKLRAYEASKLKYFFAVAELSQPEYADIIYREVDGMEFEHSSTAIDLRTLPKEALQSVISDRPIRDEATSIPGKYEPPDFIVSALQQTNVRCTWDQGDKEREKRLTNYGASNWQDSFETDDLKAYLASDGSSDEDSDEDEKKVNKKSMMRKALGLDSDSGNDSGEDNSSKISDSESDSSDEDKEDGSGDGAMSKQLTIIPGSMDLKERIRSKLESKEETKELTPWEKYQEKRKQKRKDRRQAARGNKSSENLKNNQKDTRSNDRDDFFASDGDLDFDSKFESTGHNKDLKSEKISKQRKAKEQLELLIGDDHAEEEARDYDIRGIQRLEKNKGKKLKGSRKRKEAKIAADVSGSNFKVNVKDDRFKSVLDGSDGRFGIDKTDPNFKDTASMREILSEQTKRRKTKRQKKEQNVKNGNATNKNEKKVNGNEGGVSGASALSFLVQKLKSQVDKTRS